jgi:transcriptional regulator with XRE-family HTH domain
MNSDVPDGGRLTPDLDNPRVEGYVLRVLLGTQLRRFREAAGLTPDEAGSAIRGSRSKISRIENGHVGLKSRDVEDLLTLYGVTDAGVRAKFLALTKRSGRPDWWSRYGDVLPDWFENYLGLEWASISIRTFELQFVHGLFQTEEYARAVTRFGHQTATPAEIESRVALRLKRQDLLARPDPPRVWSIMDEAVLRRQVGGAAVMRAQLCRLVEVAALPHVTLQVLPLSRGSHVGASGSFAILRFRERDLPDVVYLEQLAGAVYVEQRLEVERYLEIADLLSSEALTPDESVAFMEWAAREAWDRHGNG